MDTDPKRAELYVPRVLTTFVDVSIFDSRNNGVLVLHKSEGEAKGGGGGRGGARGQEVSEEGEGAGGSAEQDSFCPERRSHVISTAVVLS